VSSKSAMVSPRLYAGMILGEPGADVIKVESPRSY
jgi:crotonobetainyl-CoA:carnitine CoA-transferase CaiB-like acyl-CoA transferase